MLAKEEIEIIKFLAKEEKEFLNSQGVDHTVQNSLVSKLKNGYLELSSDEVEVSLRLVKEEKDYLEIYGDEKDLSRYDELISKLENQLEIKK